MKFLLYEHTIEHITTSYDLTGLRYHPEYESTPSYTLVAPFDSEHLVCYLICYVDNDWCNEEDDWFIPYEANYVHVARKEDLDYATKNNMLKPSNIDPFIVLKKVIQNLQKDMDDDALSVYEPLKNLIPESDFAKILLS